MDSLELRQLTLADTDEYYDLFDTNRNHFAAHDPRLSDSFLSLKSVAEQLSPHNAKHRLHFGVYDDRQQLIGSTALFMRVNNKAELTFWIDQEYVGQGKGVEAARHTINYGIQHLGRRSFEALIYYSNEASIRTVKKLGFQHTLSLEDDLVYTLL